MRVRALALAPLALAGSVVWGNPDDALPGNGAAVLGCATAPATVSADRAPTDTSIQTASSPDVEAHPTAKGPCTLPQSLSVLFVGNSYTLMHDLPAMFTQLGTQAGVEIHAESLAEGGKGFGHHVGQAKTVAKLQDQAWDVVVLQAHSLDPLRDRGSFLSDGSELINSVRRHGATPVLFETWARRRDSNLYNYDERTGGSPKVMQERIHAGYAELAQQTGVEVVEVGHTWRRVKHASPTLRLYADDASHPTRLGTYLTASTFFSALTDQPPPPDASPPEGIDAAVVELIHRQAAAAVTHECARTGPSRRSVVSSP